MSNSSDRLKNYRLETLLAQCEDVDMSLDDEDKAWLRSSFGQERLESSADELGKD